MIPLKNGILRADEVAGRNMDIPRRSLAFLLAIANSEIG